MKAHCVFAFKCIKCWIIFPHMCSRCLCCHSDSCRSGTIIYIQAFPPPTMAAPLCFSVEGSHFLSSSPVIDFTLVKHTYRFEPLVCQSVSVLGLIMLLQSVSNAFHTFQCGFSFRAWKYLYYCRGYCSHLSCEV